MIGPDGVTEDAVATGPAFGCLDQAEQLPVDPFSPSSKFRGSLVLDTRSDSGTLVFRPGVGGAGWEWGFGASA